MDPSNTQNGDLRTMIFYESPHKISKTLNDLKAHFGDDRKVSVSKELTKIHKKNMVRLRMA